MNLDKLATLTDDELWDLPPGPTRDKSNYDCIGCAACYYCTSCTYCSSCIGCLWCADCTDCADCTYCTGLSKASYCVSGRQFTPELYYHVLGLLDL
jgi:hypothetical protein